MKIQVAVHGYSDIKTEAAAEPCTTRLPFVLCDGRKLHVNTGSIVHGNRTNSIFMSSNIIKNSVSVLRGNDSTEMIYCYLGEILGWLALQDKFQKVVICWLVGIFGR